MEFLLLLLVLPTLWLMLLPVRVAGRVKKLPILSAGVLLALLVAGWLVLTVLGNRPATDYAKSDATLRALLE